MRLSNPAPGRPITSPYGPRRHPVTGEFGKMHTGTDFGGTFKVLSAGDGIVAHVAKEWNNLTRLQKPRQTGGNVVVIKHADNLYTAYFHGKNRSHLNVGDRVKTGDEIYISGSTGRSTGPHLHFEVRRTKSRNQIDPMAYLNSDQPVVPGGVIAVDGKLGRQTWKVWQEDLKKHWGYEGLIDGYPGQMAYRAIQRSVNIKVTGLLDVETKKGVQRRLQHNGFYQGLIDGVWGKGTISALQRALNQEKY